MLHVVWCVSYVVRFRCSVLRSMVDVVYCMVCTGLSCIWYVVRFIMYGVCVLLFVLCVCVHGLWCML